MASIEGTSRQFVCDIRMILGKKLKGFVNKLVVNCDRYTQQNIKRELFITYTDHRDITSLL